MNNRGVTLIELVVSTAVLSLLIILTMTFLVNKYVENAVTNARSDLQLQTQLTLDLLNRDLKYAANVDEENRWADENAPSSPTDNFSWESDADTLILATPAVDDDNNVLYEDPNAYVSYKDNFIYFLEEGKLFRRTIAAETANNANTTTCPDGVSGCPADSELAHIIDEFSLAYYDSNDQVVTAASARSVEITLRVHRSIFGRDVEIEQSIRTVMRND